MKKKIPNPKSLFDITKTPHHCLSQYVLSLLAIAQFEGNIKYEEYNWQKEGATFSTGYDAVKRHLNAYERGEKIDPGSGLSHIIKAMSALHVMADAEIHGMLKNDMLKFTGDVKDFDDYCYSLIADIKERYKDENCSSK